MGGIGHHVACPDFGPSAPQGNTSQTEGLQGVKQEPASGVACVADRPQALGFEQRIGTQRGGVLGEQDHRLGGHAPPGAILMGFQERLKVQIRPRVLQESVGGNTLAAPAKAGVKAPARMKTPSFQHCPKASIQFDVAQVQSIEFFVNP